MRLGLAQIDIAWEDKEANKKKVEEFVDKAVLKGCDLVLFPETTLTGFSMGVKKIADPKDAEWFKDLARDKAIAIGFGFVEMDSGKGKNRFVIVDEKGYEVLKYTKIHSFSFDGEDREYESDNVVMSVEFKGLVISPFICYDLRFPEIFQAVSNKSHLLLDIANWGKARRIHWISFLKSRAIENQAYMAGVNRTGNSPTNEYSGDSMIVDPWGETLASIGDKEGLIVADIDKSRVEEIREKFGFKKDRKNALYSKLLKNC